MGLWNYTDFFLKKLHFQYGVSHFIDISHQKHYTLSILEKSSERIKSLLFLLSEIRLSNVK